MTNSFPTLELTLEESQIQDRIKQLGKLISSRYSSSDSLSLIGILKGCQPFVSDLSHAIDLLQTVHYISSNSDSSAPTTLEDLSCLKHKNVLLVDTIADSGRTLLSAYNFLLSFQPLTLTTCCLLHRYTSTFSPAYSGFFISHPKFFVGYGLDYNETLRDLVHLYTLEEPK